MDDGKETKANTGNPVVDSFLNAPITYRDRLKLALLSPFLLGPFRNWFFQLNQPDDTATLTLAHTGCAGAGNPGKDEPPFSEVHVEAKYSPKIVDGVEVFGLNEPINNRQDLVQMMEEQEARNTPAVASLPNTATVDTIRAAREKDLDPNKRLAEIVVTQAIYDQYKNEAERDGGISFPAWIKMHFEEMNRFLREAEPPILIVTELKRVVVVSDSLKEKHKYLWNVYPGQDMTKTWVKDTLSDTPKDVDMRWGIDMDLRKASSYADKTLKYFVIDYGLVHEWLHNIYGAGDLYWESQDLKNPLIIKVGSFPDDTMSNCIKVSRLGIHTSTAIQINLRSGFRGCQVSTVPLNPYDTYPTNVGFEVNDGQINTKYKLTRKPLGKSKQWVLKFGVDGSSNPPQTPEYGEWQESSESEMVLEPMEHSNTFSEQEVRGAVYYFRIGSKGKEVVLPISRTIFHMIKWYRAPAENIKIELSDNFPNKPSNIKYTILNESNFIEIKNNYPGVVAWARIPGTGYYFTWFAGDRGETVNPPKAIEQSAAAQIATEAKTLYVKYKADRWFIGNTSNSRVGNSGKIPSREIPIGFAVLDLVGTNGEMLIPGGYDFDYDYGILESTAVPTRPNTKVSEFCQKFQQLFPWIKPLLSDVFMSDVFTRNIQIDTKSGKEIIDPQGKLIIFGPDFVFSCFAIDRQNMRVCIQTPKSKYEYTIPNTELPPLISQVGKNTVEIDTIVYSDTGFKNATKLVSRVFNTENGTSREVNINLSQLYTRLGLSPETSYAGSGLYKLDTSQNSASYLVELLPSEIVDQNKKSQISPYSRILVSVETDLVGNIKTAKRVDLSPNNSGVKTFPKIVGRYDSTHFLVAQVKENGKCWGYDLVDNNGKTVSLVWGRDYDFLTLSISNNDYYRTPNIASLRTTSGNRPVFYYGEITRRAYGFDSKYHGNHGSYADELPLQPTNPLEYQVYT